jgi:hypothetical protein
MQNADQAYSTLEVDENQFAEALPGGLVQAVTQVDDTNEKQAVVEATPTSNFATSYKASGIGWLRGWYRLHPAWCLFALVFGVLMVAGLAIGLGVGLGVHTHSPRHV